MLVAEERVWDFYNLFAGRRFADLGEYLSSDAWYIQLNSMTADNSPRGPEAVVAAYADWSQWFTDMIVVALTVTALSEQKVHEVGGAVNCLKVEYVLIGQYAQPIPNLQPVRLRLGNSARLMMRDTVWMGPNRQIIRATNIFRPISAARSGM